MSKRQLVCNKRQLVSSVLSSGKEQEAQIVFGGRAQSILSSQVNFKERSGTSSTAVTNKLSCSGSLIIIDFYPNPIELVSLAKWRNIPFTDCNTDMDLYFHSVPTCNDLPRFVHQLSLLLPTILSPEPYVPALCIHSHFLLSLRVSIFSPSPVELE